MIGFMIYATGFVACYYVDRFYTKKFNDYLNTIKNRGDNYSWGDFWHCFMLSICLSWIGFLACIFTELASKRRKSKDNSTPPKWL